MSLYDEATPNPAGHRDVQIGQLPVPFPAGVRVVDVREPSEFTGPLGHIAGAALVPMGAVMAEAHAWDKNAEVLLICKSGGRSSNVAQALTRLGFTKAMNLVGGMMAWNAAGRPTEK
ncbi:MAG: rhodanese-like domain-containing protein [Myxococcaceae bacterium]